MPTFFRPCYDQYPALSVSFSHATWCGSRTFGSLNKLFQSLGVLHWNTCSSSSMVNEADGKAKMLGFLLVSAKNRVLLLDGDDTFKNYLYQRIEIEIRQPLELSSTSSGIVTDVAESSHENLRKRSKRQTGPRFSLDEISHLFLPMVSLYRGSAALGDPIECISTGKNQVTFKQGSNEFLFLLIGRTDTSAQLMQDFQQNLAVNIGPLIELLENDYSSLKQAKDHIVSTIRRQIKGQSIYNDAVDMKRSIYHRNSVQRLSPLVKSICTQLQLFLGNNRCLLICEKSILLSAHSSGNEKPLSRFLDTRDLHGLVSQVSTQPGELRKPDISQLWLRSKTSVIPFFVNVIRFRMSHNLTLVCLHPTKADRFIRLVILILIQLDQISTGCNLGRVIHEVTESVNELTMHLQEFVSDNKDTHNDSPFLRNPLRSVQYFKGLWVKLSNDLSNVTDTVSLRKQSKRFSFHSLKSALSSFTLVASTLSLKNNNGKCMQEIPLKTDMQLNQWRRQILSLLHELHNLAKKDASTYKLSLFQDSIRRIMKSNHEKLISECSIKVAAAEMKYDKFLRPIDHKLDMLGYCLKDSEKNLEIPFESVDLKESLSNWRSIVASESCCMDVTNESGRSFTVYRLTGSKNVQRSLGIKGLLGGSGPTQLLPPELNLTVVFDSYVHKELASKQIESLVRLLKPQLAESSAYFV